MMRILVGFFPHQELQRIRRGFATIVSSGQITASGPVFARATALLGFTQRRRLG